MLGLLVALHTTTAEALDLPFSEAISFLEQKVSVPTRSHRDVWDAAHSKMFMVAGANSTALVDDFKRAIGNARRAKRALADHRIAVGCIATDRAHRQSAGDQARDARQPKRRQREGLERQLMTRNILFTRPLMLPLVIPTTGAAPYQPTEAQPRTGYSVLRDDQGNRLVDELGNRLIGQTTPSSSLIKDVWAARGGGRKFGIAVKPEKLDADPAYWALVKQEASMLVPETAFQPGNIQNVRGVFTFAKAQAFVAYAAEAGLPYRFPAGLIYPRHDMDWVSTWDDATQTIVPVLDAQGNPNINAGNWRQEIDNHLEAIAAQPWSKSLHSINVSNETIDPAKSDGWRRHPWYNAAGGAEWLVYLFHKAHELWPDIRIGLCQDITEQAPDPYYAGIRTCLLQNVAWLKAQGCRIDFLDLQGHLAMYRGWQVVACRDFLKQARSLVPEILVGEFDIRLGNRDNYLIASYSAAQADQLLAYYTALYVNTIAPFLGDTFVVWGLSDRYHAWTAGERPLLFDTALAKKPAMYAAVYENLAWS